MKLKKVILVLCSFVFAFNVFAQTAESQMLPWIFQVKALNLIQKSTILLRLAECCSQTLLLAHGTGLVLQELAGRKFTGMI